MNFSRNKKILHDAINSGVVTMAEFALYLKREELNKKFLCN